MSLAPASNGAEGSLCTYGAGWPHATALQLPSCQPGSRHRGGTESLNDSVWPKKLPFATCCTFTARSRQDLALVCRAACRQHPVRKHGCGVARSPATPAPQTGSACKGSGVLRQGRKGPHCMRQHASSQGWKQHPHLRDIQQPSCPPRPAVLVPDRDPGSQPDGPRQTLLASLPWNLSSWCLLKARHVAMIHPTHNRFCIAGSLPERVPSPAA